MYTDKQINEVFVFGAGASHASARAPLGRDLVWTHYQDCCGFTEIKQGKPDLTEENIEFANLAKFFDLVEQVYPELKGEKKRWEETRKRNVVYNPPYNLDKKYYVDEMVKILREKKNTEGVELIRQLVLEHITESSKGIKNSLYEEFVKSLAGRSLENMLIISLNFDCLLHRDLRSKIYFDYHIKFLPEDGVSHNKKDGIPLIKLNGSVDWATCQGCKKVILMPYSADKHSYGNRCCQDKSCQGKLMPYIFLPHEGKDKLVSPLWDKAREALKQASKITVIGYSFPSYDKDVINLFKEYTNNDVILEIVDHAEDADKDNKDKEIREWLKKYSRSRRIWKYYYMVLRDI